MMLGRLPLSLGAPEIQRGALENTLVIFMSDNGMASGDNVKDGKKVARYNAGMKGTKGHPDEGGTHVPAFWYWEGKLGKGVDIDGLTAHIDLYPTFVALAGVKLPKDMQPIDGRSLIPLLKDPKAEWADRKLFIHNGRWSPGRRDKFKHRRSAVRTERWRLVDNTLLYDISADPGQKNEVAATHSEVVKELSQNFDKWWESALPMMINEGLPKVENWPLEIRYQKQKKEQGIPLWKPEEL